MADTEQFCDRAVLLDRGRATRPVQLLHHGAAELPGASVVSLHSSAETDR